MRRLLYVLATIGYFLCLVRALLPTLCIGEPFWAFALMGVFASVAFAAGEGAQRTFPALVLIIALVGSIHAYRHNQRVISELREIWRESESRHRQLIQRMETNGLEAVQTNHAKATQTNQFVVPEPELSPFNCCP